MTKTIRTSIAAVAAMFALSGIAHAEGVRIDLTGKDAKTVHTEIVRAAHAVCREPGIDSISINSEATCVADTIEKATLDLKAHDQTRIARADATSAPHGDR